MRRMLWTIKDLVFFAALCFCAFLKDYAINDVKIPGLGAAVLQQFNFSLMSTAHSRWL